MDAAIRFERAQFAANGKHAKFVPSGGQGSDEVISESEAMKRYLLEQGYPEEQIIKEDKSVNTDQNICFSREKIMADAADPETVRAGVLAVCQKMVYFGVGTVIGIVRHAEHDGADLHLFCVLKSDYNKGI